MSKAILVMDVPKSCEECPCYYLTEGCYSDICQVERQDLEEGYRGGRPNWCPLREVPQKKGADSLSDSGYFEALGWNDCIDEILKGSKENG